MYFIVLFSSFYIIVYLTSPVLWSFSRLFVMFSLADPGKARGCSINTSVTNSLIIWFFVKLDGVGPVDNRPSTDWFPLFPPPFFFTCGTWHVTCDRWYVTGDMWQVICDMWHMTCDRWHMTCDMWQGEGGKHYLKFFFSFPALTAWEWRFVEYLEEKAY